MTIALAIAIPLTASVVFALGVYFGHQAAKRTIAHAREQRDHWRQIARDTEAFLSIIGGKAQR